VHALKAEHDVTMACELLGVSTSGYYAWNERPLSKRATEDLEIVAAIRKAHDESRQTYGYRRIVDEVRDAGIEVGVRRVRRLMRDYGIAGITRKLRRRIKQLESQGLHAADLVRREWHPIAPNQLWVADITQVATWQGILYVAVVMDVYSRKIVGWSMHKHMRAEIVVEALEMAISQRKPGGLVVHHSDHGSQYTSYTFGKTLRKAGILPSMGRVKTCYDNAVAESFFATLKKDLINRRTWPDIVECRSEIFEYIEAFYNTKRRHSRIGNVSPVAFEQAYAAGVS
jgi:putative transposase